ncbi:MAG TPA: putative Ig domain-containing protein, partial [Dehalococcoidales bacterium]|nr:putative Ig domain-containing protein [Dehalococcoidales bacterium]
SNFIHYGDRLAMGTAITENNLYFNPTGVYRFSSGVTGGDNQIRANPLFVNPEALDFRLQPGSPAINAGTSSLAPLTDYDGNPRPSGSGIDIGAFEFVNLNRLPVFTTIGNQTVNSGSALTLLVEAADPDGDPLTFTAANLPSGAAFNSQTRTFSWTPNTNQTGVHSNIRFTVSDGKASVFEEITITVRSSAGPLALNPIGNKSVNTGSILTFSIEATAENKENLTYSASNLPSGAAFDPSTRTFSWTPSSNQTGVFSNVVFSVTDGVSTDTQEISITVGGVNRAPALNPIGNKAANSGTALTFVISASDENDDPLTYTASNLPSGASFDSQARTFSWTPSNTQTGNFGNIRFSVSDGKLSASEEITITVNGPNRAPRLTAIGNKNVNEEATLTFVVSATDADNDILTFSASSLPSGANFNPSTRTFLWKPDNKQAGTYTNIRFSVSDGKVTAYEDITITVKDVNRAPRLNAIGEKSGEQGSLLTFAVSAVDEDEDPLTYTASNLPTGATFNGAARTFNWTPTFNQ